MLALMHHQRLRSPRSWKLTVLSFLEFRKHNIDNLNPTLNIDSVTAGQCLAEAENPDKQFEKHALADLVLVIDRRTCQGIAGRVCPFAQGGNSRDQACCTLSQGPGKLCMLTGASRWKHPILPILFVLGWREGGSMRL